MPKNLTQEEYIQKAITTHNHTYDYSALKYKNAVTEVEIICPTHGSFWQLPYNHLKGSACSKCGNLKKAAPHQTTVEFIAACNKIHNNYYTYLPHFQHIGYNVKIEITCPVHGVFKQRANNHLAGRGCPKCGRNKARTILLKDYPIIPTLQLTSAIAKKKNNVCSLVPQEHTFGCLIPGKNEFSPVLKVEEVIKTLGVVFESNNRQVIKPLELDIWIPDYKLAIEFNGKYYHSLDGTEPPQFKFKHRDKFERCQEAGISLLQIDEHEWNDPVIQEIWKSVIASKLGKHRRVFARCTKFYQISRDEAEQFLAENHLQGTTPSANQDWCYGLKLNNELVGVITFAKHEKKFINLTRMAFPRGVTVVGGAQKLFKNALKYLPTIPIVTFSNNRYSGGDVYKHLEFVSDKLLPPSYQWYFQGRVWNKRQLRRKYLPQILQNELGFNPLETEHQNMYRNGARCMYDAGYERWIYTRSITLKKIPQCCV